MCTPIVIDPTAGQVDLTGAGLGDKATAVPEGALGTTPKTPPSDPAGTGTATPAPGATTPSRVQKDTPQLAADEGRVFVPGADYPGDVGVATTPNVNGVNPASPGAGTPAVTADPGTPATIPAVPDTGTPTGSVTDPIADQNTLLINSLTTLAHKVSDTTAGILGAQADAANALSGGFLNLSDQQQKALDAANELRKNTGQAARKPSYSLSMAKVQRANSGGPSSTMLTGTGGVPTNQLALGRAQLLGGASA